MPPSDLESRLRDRFAVRTETFEHGPLSLEILLPDAAEELIDEADFDVDERLPYWADLWPSARALARRLLAGPVPGGRVLELGSGVALPSLALLSRGADVLATDWYADALLFARANAERNGLPELATVEMDWREVPEELGRFERVIAADVLYEMRNAESLSLALPRLVAPGGEAVVADPGRVYRSEFVARMAWRGWTVDEQRVREPTEYAPAGSQEIHLLTLRPPRD
ncbi:MAG TPA: methyltransferase domain-containing protein [Longimicrobiaceae bacterium]|nr:methyltransferase domain-containing protein [Longimicrobiaceae bacterium]